MITEDGIPLSPREVLTIQALERIEQALGEQGISAVVLLIVVGVAEETMLRIVVLPLLQGQGG